MGRVAGAVPRSNCGLAKGWVLPVSRSDCDSSIGCVISGRGAAADCVACCAGAVAQNGGQSVPGHEIASCDQEGS